MIILITAGILALVAILIIILQRHTSLEFVGHARLLWRTWSVRLGVLAASTGALLDYFPDATVRAWDALPPDAKSAIPPDYLQYVPWVLMGLGVVSQYVRQKKLVEKKDADANTDRTAV